MRLWHKDLIPVLPNKQLIGQWRECCAIAKNLATKGTPNHILVNKILNYKPEEFIIYTQKVCTELENRGYKINQNTWNKFQQNIQEWCGFSDTDFYTASIYACPDYIYSNWHNEKYLRICLYNLYEKFICGGISNEEWIRLMGKIPNDMIF